MKRRLGWAVVAVLAVMVLSLSSATEVQAQAPVPQGGYVMQGAPGGYVGPNAYAGQYTNSYTTRDWTQKYHYPYVYYPQNFYSQDYYRSAPHNMQRYPTEMRIPAYRSDWQYHYPSPKRYHSGHHFILDVF